jgi:antitoxin component YwqK of YwqJK toxin-antitoxin module
MSTFLLRSCFFILLFCNGATRLAAQDTTFTINGKSYNYIVYYEGTKNMQIAGNYMQGTRIRNGEWLYYHKNGHLKTRMYFQKDMKRGTWYYYDEQGKLLKKEKMREREGSIQDAIDKGELWPFVVRVACRILAGDD